MPKLAINGGKKLVNEEFPQQLYTKPYKEWEGLLSGYRGNYTQAFWGGPKVRELEERFGETLNFDYEYKSLAVNSCTSGLQIACGAIGIQPGDEVIVTPWSMSCSATAPMIYGGVPVFADIGDDDFCLDPESIKEKITPKTKAIIVVDLFGQPAKYKEIREIADEHNLFIIEDAAQAIGSYDRDRRATGTFGDISCFSFTQGKHLTCGEGGIIVTKDEDLYMKCALLRNHAEAVTNDMEMKFLEKLSEKYKHLVGFNMRMTELQASVLLEEIEKLKQYVQERKEVSKALRKFIEGEIPGIKVQGGINGNDHSYYVLPFKYYEEEMYEIPRDLFVNAVKCELSGEENRIDRGVPIGCGYIKPLYRFPIFKDRNIEPLPVVERLQNKDLFLTLFQGLPLATKGSVSNVWSAFLKVWENREELRKYL